MVALVRQFLFIGIVVTQTTNKAAKHLQKKQIIFALLGITWMEKAVMDSGLC